MSFDFTSEFKNYSPRQPGKVEECRIGNDDLVEFKNDGMDRSYEHNLTLDSKGVVHYKKDKQKEVDS